MSPTRRQDEIVLLVRKHRKISVKELASSLNSSQETIRRDLSILAGKGKIQKFHGGASLPSPLGENPFATRMNDNVQAKINIAAIATEIISPGETVLIDTGSTTIYFAEKIAEIERINVVTNSIEIARIISNSPTKSQVFLLGGEFSLENLQTTGNLAINQIGLFQAHHAILTVSAVDSNGAMDHNYAEAQFAQAMIKQAESLTIICDSSKFESIAPFKVCPWEVVTTFVCDLPPSPKLQESLTNAGVTLVVAKTSPGEVVTS